MSMKFFLTIYICSVVSQQCVEPSVDKYDYDRFYNTHYECVQKGLGESYSILFDGDLLDDKTINIMELYPKFTCEKVEQPLNPEA